MDQAVVSIPKNPPSYKRASRNTASLAALFLLLSSALSVGWYYFSTDILGLFEPLLVWLYTLVFHTGAAQALEAVGTLYESAAFDTFYGMADTLITLLVPFIIAAAFLLPSLSCASPMGGKPARGTLFLFAVAWTAASYVSSIVDNVTAVLLPQTSYYEGDLAFYGGDVTVFDYVLVFLSLCVLTPLVEEFVFRGVITGALARFGKPFAVVGGALFFALVHGSLSQMAYAFTFGLILGTVFVQTGSLKTPIILHALNNAVSFLFVDLLPELLPEDVVDACEITIQTVIYILAVVGIVWLFVHRRGKKNAPTDGADLLLSPQPQPVGFSALITPVTVLFFLWNVFSAVFPQWINALYP